MMITFLTVEEVIGIHRIVVDGIAGRMVLRDSGLLFAACGKPAIAIAGREVYPGLFLKAAVLLEALVNYHPFIDGNKRTAWLTTKVFLAMNGRHLIAKKTEEMNFVVAIANKKISLGDMENWIASHLDPQD